MRPAAVMKCFSNLSEQMNYLETLAKCRFWFRREDAVFLTSVLMLLILLVCRPHFEEYISSLHSAQHTTCLIADAQEMLVGCIMHE